MNAPDQPRTTPRAGGSPPLAALVLALALAALLVACGGSSFAEDGGGATPTETAPLSETAAPTPEEPSAIAFANCVRQNGVPNFPDPLPSGGIRVDGSITSNPNFQPAVAACAHLQPQGQQAGGAGAVEPEVLLAFAECMRTNGVPDFPDPTGGGGMTMGGGPSGFDPRSPAFQAALEICGPEHGITLNVRQ